MRKCLLIVIGVFLLLSSCTKEETVLLPDHKGLIDSNTARIVLLELQSSLHELRLNNLDVSVANLQTRLDDAEAAIVVNEQNILELLAAVDLLGTDLETLRDDLAEEVDRLQRADRYTRRLLYKKVSQLRRDLTKEIRRRRLADNNLQDQINNVESDLSSFEAQQSFANTIIFAALYLLNGRISQVNAQLQNQISALSSQLGVANAAIAALQTAVSELQSNLAVLQTQINEVESKLVAVVYPCGEENSEEILLQTQDGLVAYFQQTVSETITVGAYEIIPEYQYCDHAWKWLAICPPGLIVTVPESQNPTGDEISFSYQKLNKAYLDLLADGNYSTTDGYSCSFTVSNGAVQTVN